MTLTIPIITADDLAARAQAEIAARPPTRLTTHVPAGADRIASRLHPRRDHFHLPETTLAGITRSGSRPSRATGARRHDPISGGLAFTGYRVKTHFHGSERNRRVVPHFEIGETPRPETPRPSGSRRERRIAEMLTEANNLMGGAELDLRLAHGLRGARREEIRARARDCFASAARLVHRAEGLARAGRVPSELRAEMSDARLRVDTAGYAMGA